VAACSAAERLPRDPAVNLALPPFVAITNPVAGSSFLVGSNIAVNAIAAPVVGTITNESISGATLLGSASAAPTASW
jgi:hypothetical protein